MEIFFEDEEVKNKLFIISIMMAVWYKHKTCQTNILKL